MSFHSENDIPSPPKGEEKSNGEFDRIKAPSLRSNREEAWVFGSNRGGCFHVRQQRGGSPPAVRPLRRRQVLPAEVQIHPNPRHRNSNREKAGTFASQKSLQFWKGHLASPDPLGGRQARHSPIQNQISHPAKSTAKRKRRKNAPQCWFRLEKNLSFIFCNLRRF